MVDGYTIGTSEQAFADWEKRIQRKERERIIALLEKHEQIHDWEHSYCSCDSRETDYGTHILALIKGENG